MTSPNVAVRQGKSVRAQLTLPTRGSIRSIKKLLIPSGRPFFVSSSINSTFFAFHRDI
ncbi:unnamed protein product [Musa acuminata subsp. malaccensis]|uniref:(wild Malaysian banana) hypothetical protein n=1 Tax=Musa acuminata subsp. malaccensis TaxID=214687 RepID=A0A804IPQ7_MUSAM|nr:unnamed protein product [Musa acuminata subsp. malaccensis]